MKDEGLERGGQFFPLAPLPQTPHSTGVQPGQEGGGRWGLGQEDLRLTALGGCLGRKWRGRPQRCSQGSFAGALRQPGEFLGPR